MPVLPSDRNQSIDLLCKSINWFLYEGKTGTSWVNGITLLLPSLFVYAGNINCYWVNRSLLTGVGSVISTATFWVCTFDEERKDEENTITHSIFYMYWTYYRTDRIEIQFLSKSRFKEGLILLPDKISTKFTCVIC